MPAPVPSHRSPRTAARTAALAAGITLSLTTALTACTPAPFSLKPSNESTAKPSRSASPEPSSRGGSDAGDEPHYGPDDPEIDGSGPVGPRLQALGDRYKRMHDDGSLWKLIPETKQNTGAYLAFQFILTDMRSATRFGVDDATQTQYAKRAKHLETLLLAQKPLGTGVKYTLKDGRTFTYDGDTGEVGLE